MWLDELALYKDEMSMKSKEFIEQKIFEKRGIKNYTFIIFLCLYFFYKIEQNILNISHQNGHN